MKTQFVKVEKLQRVDELLVACDYITTGDITEITIQVAIKDNKARKYIKYKIEKKVFHIGGQYDAIMGITRGIYSQLQDEVEAQYGKRVKAEYCSNKSGIDSCVKINYLVLL